MDLNYILHQMPKSLTETLSELGVDVNAEIGRWQAAHSCGGLLDPLRYCEHEADVAYTMHKSLSSEVLRQWLHELTREQAIEIHASLGSLPHSSIELCPGVSFNVSMLPYLWTLEHPSEGPIA